MRHRFRVGQRVRLKAKLLDNAGIYEVIRLLPVGPDEDPSYRIKGVNAPVERVVREADMTAA